MGTQAMVRWGVKGLILAVGVLLLAAKAQAEPLRLRGTARVGGVSIGSTPLPFAVTRGDALTFLLTLDNVSSPGQNPVYRASFDAKVKDHELHDSDLMVSIYNDRLGSSVLILAEDFTVDDPGGYRDGISISASDRPPIDRYSGRVDGSAAFQFQTTIGFQTAVSRLSIPLSNPTTLESESLPFNSQVWNSFEAREFLLQFLPDNSRVGVYVDALELVPESPSLLIAAIVSFVYAIRKRLMQQMHWFTVWRK